MTFPSNQARLQSVAGPKQARSEQTLARLLDAAERLIAERGFTAVSIPDIVQAAQASVGGFYARFRDKNELLMALEERFHGEVEARLGRLLEPARWEGLPLVLVIEAAVRELVTVTRQRQRLLAAFLHRALIEPRFRADAIEFRRRAARGFAELILGREMSLAHPDPALAVDLGVQAALALMQQHVLFGETEAAGRRLGDGDLEREITDLFLRYIGARGNPALPMAPG